MWKAWERWEMLRVCSWYNSIVTTSLAHLWFTLNDPQKLWEKNDNFRLSIISMRKTNTKAVWLMVFVTVTMKSTTIRFNLLLECLVLRPRTGSNFLSDHVASHDSRCYLQSIMEFCALEKRQKSAIWIPRRRWNFYIPVYSEEPDVNARQHLSHVRVLTSYTLFGNIRPIWGSNPGRARVLPKEISDLTGDEPRSTAQ
jgi:hypothetical protein